MWGSRCLLVKGMRRDDGQRSRGRILGIYDFDSVRLIQLSCLG
jgi:hypothetical protein